MLENLWTDFREWLAQPATNAAVFVLYAAIVVALWLLQRRRMGADRKNRRAEKFEELVAALFDHKHWLDTMSKIRVFDQEGQLTTSPFARVQAISSAYFPELAQEIAELDLAAERYETWILDAREKRLRDDQSYLEGGREAYNSYFEQFHSLQTKLRAFARGEFR
jgi:hypothetical protein